MTTFKCPHCGSELHITLTRGAEDAINCSPSASPAGSAPAQASPFGSLGAPTIAPGEPDRDWHASEKQIAFAKKIAAALHHDPIPDFNNMTWRDVGNYIHDFKAAFYATPESKEGI